MAKIAEVVALKTGYANFVDLKNAFEAAQENADRMSMYRPTKAHRKAFERICQGLFQPKDKKFYLLSGSYGTGKSHLCLMMANFLSRSSGDPEIAGFYENYAKLDPDMAQKLKNIRKGGQYLVAICDYHSGRRFEDVVLKAVFEACAARGLDAELITEFDEAERQLAKWEEKGGVGGIRNFYGDFEKTLETLAPGLSVTQLRAGLKDYDSDLLETFRATFREMMGGIEFRSQAGNLIPIVRKLVKSQAFKDRFKGLAIFFDEFGFALEKGSYTKDILQGFMEAISKEDSTVLFIGSIHKKFQLYADRFSIDDAEVMSARITHVDLLNEGIEEIIGAIVETDKDGEVWTNEVAPKTGVFDQLVPVCHELKLFPWITELNRLRERVLEDIYGVHPMALSCLLKLSAEIGSDARSTFTFFSGEIGGEKESYADFIRNADVTMPGGNLNLYGVDRLFTFFTNELSQKNIQLRDQQRQYVNGYYNSVDALRKASEGGLFGFQEDLRLNVLRTILIYQLCQIPTNLENLQFGLYCLSAAEKNRIKDSLKEMVRSGVVFFRKQSKTYELAASTGEDPYDLIDRFIADPELHPADLVAAFLDESAGRQPPEFIEAKGYNLPFGEDKRFRMRFVRAKDLGVKLWDDIQKDFEENRNKPAKSFEGACVYTLCEDDSEIGIAREAVKTVSDLNVAVAIPKAAQPFTEMLLRVKACRYYLRPDNPMKITAQTESRFRDILENADDGYWSRLQRLYCEIKDGGSACWFWQEGKVLVDKPAQAHKPVDMLCDELFTKRCRIKHPDLNLCHDDKWRTGKNPALKQAVDRLLEAERVMIDNGNPDNHGEKRYLEKVLLRGAGALMKTGAEGNITYFTCETDPAKIHDDFPVLKELYTRLSSLKPGETFAVGAFLDDVQNAPYGVGGTPLLLSFAHVLRAYGERLIAYRDSTKIHEQRLESYNDLCELLSAPVTQTVCEVRTVSPAQGILIDLMAKAVGAPPLKFGVSRTVTSAFELLKKWWSDLPSVAKIISLYEESRRPRLTSLKNLMAELSDTGDRFDFMLVQVPAIYRHERMGDVLTESDVTEIGEAFAADVALVNSGYQLAQGKVAQALCEIYGTTGDLVECEKAITQWYVDLNPSQRDPNKCEHEAARHLLVLLSNRKDDFGKKILELLPKDYGFSAVANWTSIHTKDYAAKVKQAKTEIDKAKPQVSKPRVDAERIELRENESAWVKMPEGVNTLIYTTDDSDPKTSTHAQKVTSDLNLADLIKNRSTHKLTLRAVDNDGNYSDSVKVELISRERKYEIQINTIGEATFKCPDDVGSMLTVLKSVISYGVKKQIVDSAIADNLIALMNATLKDNQ